MNNSAKENTKNNLFYIKITDYYCKLIIEDRVLLDYLKEEYLLLKGHYRALFWVKVTRVKNKYFFYSKKIQREIEIGNVVDFKYLDFIIMVFIAYQALDANILLLHASSFEKNKQGYIFFGRQGSGKSTIVKKVPRNKIFSDDTAVIKKIKKDFYLFPSPFDKKHLSLTSKNPVILKKIYMLRQSVKNLEVNLDYIIKFIALSNNDVYFYSARWLFKSKNLSRKKTLHSLIMQLISRIEITKLLFNNNFNPYEDP